MAERTQYEAIQRDNIVVPAGRRMILLFDDEVAPSPYKENILRWLTIECDDNRVRLHARVDDIRDMVCDFTQRFNWGHTDEEIWGWWVTSYNARVVANITKDLRYRKRLVIWAENTDAAAPHNVTTIRGVKEGIHEESVG